MNYVVTINGKKAGEHEVLGDCWDTIQAAYEPLDLGDSICWEVMHPDGDSWVGSRHMHGLTMTRDMMGALCETAGHFVMYCQTFGQGPGWVDPEDQLHG